MSLFHLYVDDSGSRFSDRPQTKRADGMDYFALGGVLIEEAAIGQVRADHKAFVNRWGLNAPLHSTKIRGKRQAFSWLGTDEARAKAFFDDLDRFIASLPILSIACVIDRPGYNDRYAEKHPEPWLLCQTAFAILVERAAKFARDRDSRLVIYFEECGRMEDRALMGYMKGLKSVGMPFPGSAAGGYDSLSPEDFRQIVHGEPNRITKAVPMVQIADLVLYAMARGGYYENYPPFRALHDRCQIIDAVLKPEECPARGVKYSCFDTTKARIAPSP